MIQIGNRRNGDTGEYVGRAGSWGAGSPLGNPYPTQKLGRDGACDAYAKWFARGVTAGRDAEPAFFAELDRLRAIHRDRGDLTLACWCAPLRCHAETIKAWLEANP